MTGEGIRRRSVLAGAAGLAGAGIGLGAGYAAHRGGLFGAAQDNQGYGRETVDFHGDHQAGVSTPAQAYGRFIGLDLVPGADAEVLAGILALWTEDAERLTQGRPGLADVEPELAALPARLTVTVGLGPGAFDAADRVDQRPVWLRPLPEFVIDRLDPQWGQTDLLLQICADDEVTVAHAARVLLASVVTRVRARWTQQGFRTARGTQHEGVTANDDDSGAMRNLMGQVDGTVNPEPALHDSLIWDDGSDAAGARQPWFAGGTSLVLRRIAMDLVSWEELDRPGRELTVGRTLDSGAPLTGDVEHDDPDFSATKMGIPVIPPNAHIARAHRRNEREQFLRRGYNYDDPRMHDRDHSDAGPATESGLIFAAYQRDIDTQFLPVQQRLADADFLNEWISPIGSAVYAILPGVAEGESLGSALLS